MAVGGFWYVFILKYPFPVLLAAHAMIPGQDGVSTA